MHRTTLVLLRSTSVLRHKPSVVQPLTCLKYSMASPATLAAQTAMSTIDLSNYDPKQSKLMDERCILVDEQDRAIGAMDKKTCMFCMRLFVYFFIAHFIQVT